MKDNYKSVLADLLHGMNFVERDRYSKDDFVTIICPEHGMYYKTVKDVLTMDPECPKCNFLNPNRMFSVLLDAKGDMEVTKDLPRALFYRILVTHKRTGLVFQKIGISESPEDFIDFWNPWKWKDFLIEPIDKIECSEEEAKAILEKFQKENTSLKMTVPNELKFNLNKTYHWDEIWQAKSKTIPVLRECMIQKQQGECSVCGKPVKAPTLDHEHIKRVHGTGYIRAVCCSQCNTFIARSENNAARHGISLEELPQVLRNMADHLENKTRIIHPTEVPKRKKVGIRDWNRVKKFYFKVFPKRRTLPDKPTYITDSWLELKHEIDTYIDEQQRIKESTRKRKRSA